MGEPVYEKISYCQKIQEIKEQIKIDTKTNVNSQEISSVLSVWPVVVIEDSVVMQGKIKYNGKICFYICYLDSQNAIKKCECASEFNGQISNELITEDTKISITATVEKAGAETESAYLTASAYINLSLSCTKLQEQNALCGGQDLFIDQKEIELVKGLGVRQGVYPIEEKFDLSFGVEEVMFHSANATINSVQSGVGCIIVEGQVLLCLVLLQNKEKRDIIKVCKSLPYKMEIECEEAMPNMFSTATVKERAIKTDIQVDQDANTSTVNVSVSLHFEGQTYLNQPLVIASDVFSTKNHLQLTNCSCQDVYPRQLLSLNFIINGSANVAELALSTNILATCQENVNILSHSVEQDKMTITGIYTTLAFLVDGEGKVFSRRLEVPFERTIEGQFDNHTQYTFTAKAFRGNGKIVSATQIDIDTEIYLNCYLYKMNEYEFISDLVEGEKKQQKQSAISVYISQGGEQLFSLAKSLNVCPDTLISTNSNLQFPLNGSERILVYRQLQ